MFTNLHDEQRKYDRQVPDDDRSDDEIEADAEAAAKERQLLTDAKKAQRDDLLKPAQ